MPQTPPDTHADLASYDVILVNISGRQRSILREKKEDR
jgi:hypothetical protein